MRKVHLIRIQIAINYESLSYQLAYYTFHYATSRTNYNANRIHVCRHILIPYTIARMIFTQLNNL